MENNKEYFERLVRSHSRCCYWWNYWNIPSYTIASPTQQNPEADRRDKVGRVECRFFRCSYAHLWCPDIDKMTIVRL